MTDMPELRKEELLSTPIRQIDLERTRTIGELLNAFGGASIQARNLSACLETYREMLEDRECTIFLGISGPLIAAGLRKVLSDMVKKGLVDVIVTTGAIVYQDFYQARGFSHYRGDPEADDTLLREQFVDRIYDTYVDEEGFRETDTLISRIVNVLEPCPHSSRELLRFMGEQVDDQDSILRAAAERGVPVFAPAIADSSIGIGLTLHYKENRNRGAGFSINPIRDNYEITRIRMKSKHTGAIYIGGGVPKNYINDTEVTAQMMGSETEGHTYAFQLTMDMPFWGGLSGSTLKEAKSWGKVHGSARGPIAYVEASVSLPLIVGAVLEKGYGRGRRVSICWDDDEPEIVRE